MPTNLMYVKVAPITSRWYTMERDYPFQLFRKAEGNDDITYDGCIIIIYKFWPKQDIFWLKISSWLLDEKSLREKN